MVDKPVGDASFPQDFLRPAPPEQQRQIELRQIYERDELELKKQTALIKKDLGPLLLKNIEQAGERTLIDVTEIKTLAVAYLAGSLAANKGFPDNKRLMELCEQSIRQAEDFQERQRQQESQHSEQEARPEQSQHELKGHATRGQSQDAAQPQAPARQQGQSHIRQMQPESGKNQVRIHGHELREQNRYEPLNETHSKVGNEIAPERATRRERLRGNFGYDGADRGQVQGRCYEPLNETHREVAEASKPLDRSGREAREAESRNSGMEITDTRAERRERLNGNSGSESETSRGPRKENNGQGHTRDGSSRSR